jgi:cyanophycin synthetase
MSDRHLVGLYHRLRYYLDVPTLRLLLRFRVLSAQFYADLWRTAAQNIGAESTPWRFGYVRVRRNGMTTVVNLSRVMLDDHLTLNIMGNKVLTYDLLAEGGYRIPRFCTYTLATFAAAQAFLVRSDGPVVVKPAAGTGGGRGITTGISSVGALRQASRLAARHGETLIVEEQVAGDSYRLLYLDGRFLDAVRRDPPTVAGDGRHTIRQLIRLENRRRLAQRPFTSLSPLLVDRDSRNWLEAHGLSPRSRPAMGDTVVVKRAVNQNCARENHNVRELVHPQLIEDGGRLVTALGVRLAGVDLICSDITVPLSQSGGCFNEVNTTPGIHHHYLIAQPEKGVPVAELLLEHLFTTRQGVMTV